MLKGGGGTKFSISLKAGARKVLELSTGEGPKLLDPQFSHFVFFLRVINDRSLNSRNKQIGANLKKHVWIYYCLQLRKCQQL